MGIKSKKKDIFHMICTWSIEHHPNCLDEKWLFVSFFCLLAIKYIMSLHWTTNRIINWCKCFIMLMSLLLLSIMNMYFVLLFMSPISRIGLIYSQNTKYMPITHFPLFQISPYLKETESVPLKPFTYKKLCSIHKKIHSDETRKCFPPCFFHLV